MTPLTRELLALYCPPEVKKRMWERRQEVDRKIKEAQAKSKPQKIEILIDLLSADSEA